MRVLLFLITNVAVLATAAVAMGILTALGVIPQDSPYLQLLIWCALFGFGGSFISLAMSKWVAKRSTRASGVPLFSIHGCWKSIHTWSQSGTTADFRRFPANWICSMPKCTSGYWIPSNPATGTH